MPFTFAHPAIVLPLPRLAPRWFNATALIIGSMSPDFEYFLRLAPITTISHSFVGLFIFNLPLTIALALLYLEVIRASLIANLPSPLDQWWHEYRDDHQWPAGLREWSVFISSALIGVASHMLWDGFTHEDDIFVSHWSLLSHQLTIAQHQVKIYDILQYGSSAIGMLIVLIVLLCTHGKTRPIKPRRANDKLHYWAIVSAITVAIALPISIHQQLRIATANNFFNFSFLVKLLVTSISGGMVGLLLASLGKEKFSDKPH